MAKIVITMPGYRCERCEHEWVARSRRSAEGPPRICPKCKSALWDIPKREKVAGG